MPVLSNPRHERFAQLLAQLHGKMTVTDAHEQAGYRRMTVTRRLSHDIQM
jgi:DeoR/GlpR family transcriptional regulator of sugar metabolism